MTYNPRTYWTNIAERIHERSPHNFIAGDDSPLGRYKRSLFLENFRTIDFVNKSVLEVGCGPGGNLDVVKNATPKRLVGCDISEKMIELARENIQGVELFIIDGSTLPFEDKTIDITFTVTVLHHNFEMLEGLLKDICRVTSEKIILFEDTANKLTTKESYIRRPISHYQSIIEKHGFKLTQIYYINDFCSYWAARIISKAVNSHRKEGEPLVPVEISCQKLCLPIAKLGDKLFKSKQGLTKIVFETDTSG
jgi:SAM-dependent methyltransferase